MVLQLYAHQSRAKGRNLREIDAQLYGGTLDGSGVVPNQVSNLEALATIRDGGGGVLAGRGLVSGDG